MVNEKITNNKTYDLEERTAKFGEDIINFAKKEANETKYWLRLLVKCHSELEGKIKILWQEAHEFHLIFQKVTNTINKNKN